MRNLGLLLPNLGRTGKANDMACMGRLWVNLFLTPGTVSSAKGVVEQGLSAKSIEEQVLSARGVVDRQLTSKGV